MFLVGLLNWWYGRGWMGEVSRVGGGLKRTAEFFSIGQLAGTLFAPFRQISAGQVQGALGIQLRAFLDRLISRCVGAVVRLMTIFAGLFTLGVQSLLGALTLVLWPLLPLAVVAGLLLFAIGWVPVWM